MSAPSVVSPYSATCYHVGVMPFATVSGLQSGTRVLVAGSDGAVGSRVGDQVADPDRIGRAGAVERWVDTESRVSL
jgi:hypothetical protein